MCEPTVKKADLACAARPPEHGHPAPSVTCGGSGPLPPRVRGQNAHAPEIAKINRPEFPAGRKLAGLPPDFGRQDARLQYTSQFLA